MVNKQIKWRTLLVGAGFTLFFIALIFRVYWVQVVMADDLMNRAAQMWETDRILEPKRGTIFDRNGNILAENAQAYTVAVNPGIIHANGLEQAVVKGLSEILNKPEKELYELVTKRKKDGSFYLQVEIRNEGWKIDVGKANEVKRLIEKIEKEHDVRNAGIFLIEEQKRYYPYNTLASHVLGYLNKEGEAVLGIEEAFDEVLKGSPGSISYEKDRKGYRLPDAKIKYEPPVNGHDVKLTIDQNIQSYMEEALEKAYAKYQPKSISAVAVDPNTMEILGIANLPNFNPNEYWKYDTQKDFFNFAVSAQFEPGSTFKVITLAAAVEEGLFRPFDTFESGKIVVSGETLRDHNWTGWGRISFLEGLIRSSNVAFVKLGYEMLGEQKLKEYIEKFGFGLKTGIQLPGEAAGKISLRYPVEYATATYGQGGIVVTALQQAMAVSAVANGGKLMEPRIVKEIIDSESGKTIQSFPPKEIRRVISESTSRQLGEYLEQVVSNEKGTGKNAFIEGYRVAGKTGTANKVINGEYARDKWIISFIGYAPVEDPKILVCVVADEPQISNYQEGGHVAPPVFKEIMSQSLRYLKVPSKQQVEIADQNLTLTVPQLTHLSLAAAKNELEKSGLTYTLLGDGEKVIRQFPGGGEKMAKGRNVYLITEPVENIELPDLTGFSMREALEICSILGAHCRVEGEGYVAEQKLDYQNGKKSVVLRLSPYFREQSSQQERENSGSQPEASEPTVTPEQNP